MHVPVCGGLRSRRSGVGGRGCVHKHIHWMSFRFGLPEAYNSPNSWGRSSMFVFDSLNFCINWRSEMILDWKIVSIDVKWLFINYMYFASKEEQNWRSLLNIKTIESVFNIHIHIQLCAWKYVHVIKNIIYALGLMLNPFCSLLFIVLLKSSCSQVFSRTQIIYVNLVCVWITKIFWFIFRVHSHF